MMKRTLYKNRHIAAAESSGFSFFMIFLKFRRKIAYGMTVNKEFCRKRRRCYLWVDLAFVCKREEIKILWEVFVMTNDFGLGVEYVYGYVGDEYVGKVSIEPEQVAAFIMKFKNAPETKLVNIMDILEMSTLFGMVFFCRDQAYMRKLLPVLVPMQMTDKEPPEWIPYVEEIENVINNVIMQSGAGWYLGSLHFEDGLVEPYSRDSEYYRSAEEVKKAYPDAIDTAQAFHLAKERNLL
jgi:hypothetical protein